MQVQLDDIAGGESLLRQIREEEFIDDALTRESDRALLLASWMGGYHHETWHVLGSDRHCRAVVEAAHDLAFWALLELIWGRCRRAWTSG